MYASILTAPRKIAQIGLGSKTGTYIGHSLFPATPRLATHSELLAQQVSIVCSTENVPASSAMDLTNLHG